tara:strand:+ start:1007 stop:1393 length:387 start_codon:yes stop_codon:yes gene_type:complete
MTKLILDAAREKIFLMIIDDNSSYNISFQNSKTNYEKLILLINEFLVSKNLDLKKISEIYVNRGPGSFAGIRNSLSVVKAIHLANKINYFCFSFKDFNGENEVKYEFIPQLCEKFKVKKNLINPIYMS